MKSGRELDALVAEKVMGLTVAGWAEVKESVVFFGRGTAEPVYVARCECEWARANPAIAGREEWGLGHWFGCLADVPAYSTSIAAAWQVVEKIKGTAFLSVAWFPKRAAWNCLIAGTDEQDRADELGPTAPHAICLAALVAVGAKVPA